MPHMSLFPECRSKLSSRASKVLNGQQVFNPFRIATPRLKRGFNPLYVSRILGKGSAATVFLASARDGTSHALKATSLPAATREHSFDVVMAQYLYECWQLVGQMQITLGFGSRPFSPALLAWRLGTDRFFSCSELLQPVSLSLPSDVLLDCLVQLGLTMQSLFSNDIQFMHRDLHFNNLMLRPRRRGPQRITFQTTNGDTIDYRSRFELILVDFGHASLQHGDVLIQSSSPLYDSSSSFCPSHDIRTLLVCLFEGFWVEPKHMRRRFRDQTSTPSPLATLVQDLFDEARHENTLFAQTFDLPQLERLLQLLSEAIRDGISFHEWTHSLQQDVASLVKRHSPLFQPFWTNSHHKLSLFHFCYAAPPTPANVFTPDTLRDRAARCLCPPPPRTEVGAGIGKRAD